MLEQEIKQSLIPVQRDLEMEKANEKWRCIYIHLETCALYSSSLKPTPTSLVASSTCVLIGVICCFKELRIGDPCSCVVSVWRVSGKSFLTHWSVPDHSLGSFHLSLYGPQPWADDRKARLESQRPPLTLTVPFDRTGHSTAVKLRTNPENTQI